MIKITYLIFFSLIINLLSFPLVCFAEVEGFRGIKWGTDFVTLTEMQYVRTDPSYGGIKEYTKKSDELMIGGATLETILYGFWQGKFSSVLIRVKGYSNFSSLKNATFEKFGSGFQSNRYIERYAWFGEQTTMLLNYSELLRTGELFMFSNEIESQQKKYEKDNAKKGAEKDF
ncbi:MAG: hypothetical protein WA081_22620 [Desulfosalsimonadaceae bacterium]